MFFQPLRDSRQRRLRDRTEAGQLLAEQLTAYAGRSDVLVLGLPRGGVPVAYAIAQALQAPLDVFVVRKLGAPGQPELALGAIASGGTRVLNDDVVWSLDIDEEMIDAVVAQEQQELARRERLYRGERPPLVVRGKTVILVDDGVATGATIRAAIAALHSQRPAKLIVAVGVAPPETCTALEQEVDEVVCLLQPEPFWAVGLWFADFGATSDEEVRSLLAQAAADYHQAEKEKTMATSAKQPIQSWPVQIAAGAVTLAGDLVIPPNAQGLVLFAHGSGSSRFSPRNRFVAQTLQEGGLATLLFDLLTPGEERIDLDTRQLRFNIALLAERLVATTDWVAAQPQTQHCPIGYFGASTGAAAALIAAAQRADVVAAVVARGGRPDLALPVLAQVKAPTLLLVGGADHPVIALNQEALAHLGSRAKLEIIPGAGHLFEEPGTLAAVAQLARDWFCRSFTAAPTTTGTPAMVSEGRNVTIQGEDTPP
ncbi:MAG: phosphoribosyltransferase [Caldilinea sp. CFX5]|nr:phosphoribosyltransferase [Caldilinea sp. CFX5]